MFTDEKNLLQRTAEDDENAFNDLLKLYAPLIHAEVRRFSPSFVTVDGTPRLSEENLEQVARIAVFNAARTFDGTKEKVTFGLYAKICIRNALISELRRVHPHKQEQTKIKETQTAAKSDTDAERQKALRLRSQTEEMLSDYERKVFGLYLQGFHPRDIAKRLGKSEKSVYNALCRIRAKTRGAKNSPDSMP